MATNDDESQTKVREGEGFEAKIIDGVLYRIVRAKSGRKNVYKRRIGSLEAEALDNVGRSVGVR